MAVKKRPKKKIEPQHNVQEFFRILVSKAIKDLHVEASELAEFYLVNLLKEFTMTENIYAKKDEKLEEEPLALMLKRAIDATPNERIKILKKLGDFSLYISGFFPESLTKNLIDSKYYAKMGGTAYNNLSRLLTTYKHLKELYLELAVKFALFSQVLTVVSKEGAEENSKKLLSLYENWVKTGDKKLEEFLFKKGFALDKKLAKKIQ